GGRGPPGRRGADERRDDVLRVLPHAEQERRLALREPVEPDEVEPRHRGDSAGVDRPAAAVDGERLDPAEVRAVTVRPDDRVDAVEIELADAPRRHGPGHRTRVLGDLEARGADV